MIAPARIPHTARPPGVDTSRSLPVVRIVALLLGCFTVATLVAAAALTRVPSSTDAPSPATIHAAVERFVDAANATITTGDGAAFDGVLAEDFRLHAEATGIGSDRAALARYLAGVRATYPDASFVSDDVMADGHLALLRFELHGGGSGAVAGVPVGRPLIPGDGVAILRVAGRRVAEVWGFVSLPAVEPVSAVTVTAHTSGSVVGAARVTYAPGAEGANVSGSLLPARTTPTGPSTTARSVPCSIDTITGPGRTLFGSPAPGP